MEIGQMGILISRRWKSWNGPHFVRNVPQISADVRFFAADDRFFAGDDRFFKKGRGFFQKGRGFFAGDRLQRSSGHPQRFLPHDYWCRNASQPTEHYNYMYAYLIYIYHTHTFFPVPHSFYVFFLRKCNILANFASANRELIHDTVSNKQ